MYYNAQFVIHGPEYQPQAEEEVAEGSCPIIGGGTGELRVNQPRPGSGASRGHQKPLAPAQARREVMNEQRAQLEAQADSMRKQAFEGTFFQMLGLLRDVVGAFPKGSAYFQDIIQDISANHVQMNDRTLISFDNTWGRFGPTLMPYYRTLEVTLEFAKTAPKDSNFYIRLAAAQLSRSELVVLVYACYGGLVPTLITEVAHCHGFFDDLLPNSFNNHTADGMMAWIRKERNLAREGAE